MTTGYNIACALHPSLVSIPFYAIPISLSIIHRIFYLLVTYLSAAAITIMIDMLLYNLLIAMMYNEFDNMSLCSEISHSESSGAHNVLK